MRENVIIIMGDPDPVDVKGSALFADKVKGRGGGMNATEGIREYEVSPGLWRTMRVKDLRATTSHISRVHSGGIRGLAHLEGLGGGGIDHVDNGA